MQSTHSNLNSGCGSLALCRHAPGSSRNCVIFSHLILQGNPCMLVAPLPSLKQVFPHTSSKPSADGLLILSRYTLGRIQSFFKLCFLGGLSINNISFALTLATHRHFFFFSIFIYTCTVRSSIFWYLTTSLRFHFTQLPFSFFFFFQTYRRSCSPPLPFPFSFFNRYNRTSIPAMDVFSQVLQAQHCAWRTLHMPNRFLIFWLSFLTSISEIRLCKHPLAQALLDEVFATIKDSNKQTNNRGA